MVFVDDYPWTGFNQFSAQLRRSGLRTVRVNANGLVASRLSARLLYDRYEVLSSNRDEQGLRSILGGENVLDVHYVETLAPLLLGALDVLRGPLAVTLRRRLEITDKFVTSGLLSSAGVRTPTVMSLAHWTPEQAVKELGLPLVVKERVGSGGREVVITRDLEELRAAASHYVTKLEDAYFEKFIDGDKLNYAAVVGTDGPVQELTYRVSKWVQPVGTAIEVELIDDRRLAEFGRRAVEVLGCTGVVNMDILRDQSGTDWLIDFNPRVFGGASNFLCAGIDLVEGYKYINGLRDDSPEFRHLDSGVKVRIFPNSLNESVHTGSYLRSIREFLRESLLYLKWLGSRYWLYELGSVILSVRKFRRRRSIAS